MLAFVDKKIQLANVLDKPINVPYEYNMNLVNGLQASGLYDYHTCFPHRNVLKAKYLGINPYLRDGINVYFQLAELAIGHTISTFCTYI